jgi:hypothetical protein
MNKNKETNKECIEINFKKGHFKWYTFDSSDRLD